MKYHGDIRAGATIRGTFNTRSNSTGAPITLAGTPALRVYKDDGTTEDDSGITLNVDFDSRTGLHVWEIDTAADGTFYSSGANYSIVLTVGTVDSISVVGVCVGEFSIDNRAGIAEAVFSRAFSADYGDFTFDEMLKIMVAALAGKASGLPTAPVFRDLDDSANVISATTDANGNRSAVTLTP